MFDHVTIRVSDRAASERFYTTVLPVLGVQPTSADADFIEWDDFSLTAADAAHPVTRGLHIGFGAASRDVVDAFWRAGTAAGYTDDGAPGPRPQYGDDYYGGFLRDPDGNSVEAVHHDHVRRGGNVDHVWIRVPDVAAERAFYAAVAEPTGLRIEIDEPDRVQVVGASGSFSLIADTPPTEHVHLAFPAPDRAAVDAFHRVALAAGYSDNGAPGERPEYHDGYYAAFVCDPAGHNVELVHHG